MFSKYSATFLAIASFGVSFRAVLISSHISPNTLCAFLSALFTRRIFSAKPIEATVPGITRIPPTVSAKPPIISACTSGLYKSLKLLSPTSKALATKLSSSSRTSGNIPFTPKLLRTVFAPLYKSELFTANNALLSFDAPNLSKPLTNDSLPSK